MTTPSARPPAATTPSASPSPATSTSAKLIIRVVLATVGTLAAALLAGIWSLLWLLPTGSDSESNGVLIVAALLTSFVAPVILFVLISSWPIESVGQRHPALRASSWGMGGLEVVALAIVIVTGYLTQPWGWLPISAILMGAGFTAVAVVLGRVLRTERAGVPVDASGELVLGPWTPPGRTRVRMFALVVLAVFLLATLLAAVAFQPWHHVNSARPAATVAAIGIFSSFAIGCFVASLVCAIRYFPLAMRLSSALPAGYAARRHIARAVSRGRVDALSRGELELGRRFAVDSVVALPWMLLQFGLLYLGLISIELGQSFEPFWPLVLLAPIVLIAAFIALFVFVMLRIRRLRRFLATNGEPTATGTPSPVPAPVPA
jgi:MFS family permease